MVDCRMEEVGMLSEIHIGPETNGKTNNTTHARTHASTHSDKGHAYSGCVTSDE